MMKQAFFWIIILIALIAIYGTTALVMNEWQSGEACPKILGIPACYIVFVAFTLGLIGHLKSGGAGRWIFIMAIGLVTIIATTGTIGELTGTAKCPRTTGGTPMCFISLGICISLLVSKFLYLKLSLKAESENKIKH